MYLTARTYIYIFTHDCTPVSTQNVNDLQQQQRLLSSVSFALIPKLF